MLEIRPANLAQVTTYGGKMLMVSDDVTDVAKQLAEIDPDLKLLCAAEANPVYWVVRHDIDEPDGSVTEHLVLTTYDLGSHIVERVRQIASGSYDYAAELERADAKARADEEHRFSEQRGPILERLSHAVRHDLGIKRDF